MILDRSHFKWVVATVGIALAALILYEIYVFSAPNGASGGSWQGMLFGIAGTACMIYAGLLSGRKSVPKWRIGKSQTWLRGHIWFGLLSVPLILMHSGFRWGGLVEQLLMLTFAVVIASGVLGIALQNILPRLMSNLAPAQAIAPQIHVACQKLLQSAEITVQRQCADQFLAPLSQRSGDVDFSPERELARFYWNQLSTFLKPDSDFKHELANPTLATARFSRLRDSVSEQFLPVIEELELACNERRQLLSQQRIHNWLHGWLCIHVPLSVTLLVLGVVHVFMSVYY